MAGLCWALSSEPGPCEQLSHMAARHPKGANRGQVLGAPREVFDAPHPDAHAEPVADLRPHDVRSAVPPMASLFYRLYMAIQAIL